ncbi:MAG: hypothetical protein JXA77_05025 [Bacteroidales bacterium]|nr:hypothetical protein [Bacteroidales bacterium]MBN2820410.1 hypothetical protein [Bacteroidales bacterium]
MKKNIILLGMLIVISWISCEKEKENEDKIITDSSFYAIKNDSEWISTSCWSNYSLNDKNSLIVGAKRDAEFYQDEQLHFSFKTADISKSNTVTNFYSEWNFIVGGDAISDTYIIDSYYNNVIVIDLFDKIAKQVTGSFEIKLVRDKFRSDLGETMLCEKLSDSRTGNRPQSETFHYAKGNQWFSKLVVNQTFGMPCLFLLRLSINIRLINIIISRLHPLLLIII